MARRLLAACLLGMLVLSGCGGSPQERSTKTASPSPTGTTSTVPEVPGLPEAARADTKEGAVAFVRHFLDLVNHAQSTGDVAPFRAASLDTCESCTAGADRVAAIYGAGGHLRGGVLSAKEYQVLGRGSAAEGWAIAAVIDSTPQAVLESKGAKPRHLKPDNLPMTFQVGWTASGWRMHDWTRSR